MSGCRFAVNTFILPWMSDMYPGGGAFIESSWMQANAKRRILWNPLSSFAKIFLPENGILQQAAAMRLFVSGPI